jgi:2-amino-4-hydroxy-6-hydroxymethyldihydropteridine diphosphokinase
MVEMNYAYLLLGTNLGNKINNIETALSKISSVCGVILIQSSIYETEAWGITTQPSFLNKVIKITTQLSAEKLLEQLLLIEMEMGRVRQSKWAERVIDLDILYFNEEIIVKERLKIPHPELHNRRFTLVPLCEIAPEYKHPVLNINNKQLLEQCNDKGKVLKF